MQTLGSQRLVKVFASWGEIEQKRPVKTEWLVSNQRVKDPDISFCSVFPSANFSSIQLGDWGEEHENIQRSPSEGGRHSWKSLEEWIITDVKDKFSNLWTINIGCVQKSSKLPCCLQPTHTLTYNRLYECTNQTTVSVASIATAHIIPFKSMA